jgi:hypothetical protein
MSDVHVYGVVPASAKLELADGVRAVRVLRTHWRVLEQASSSTTVLPVRFGTVMTDDEAVVEDFLRPEHEDLAARLAAMAGKVQLTVKGFYEEDALMASVVARSPVIARLREQVRGLPEAAAYYKRIELGQLVAAEVERARERDAHEILERLRPFALAARLEPPSAIEAAAHAAFLVDERRVDEFSQAVSGLGRELAGRIRLQYVGPLPPFSFTGEDAQAGTGAWA